MEAFDVILEYRRENPVWVCADCDSENGFENSCCLFCGRQRVVSDYIIKAWTPSVAAPPPPVETHSPSYTLPTSTTSPPTPVSDNNNQYLIWIIVGAVILFVILIAAIAANAADLNTSSADLGDVCYENIFTGMKMLSV